MHNKGKKLNPEVLSAQELYRFLGSFKETMAGVRNRAIFATQAFSGIRINEALDLRIDDVDLEKQCVTVICGKFSKRRTVGIGAPAIEHIKAWLKVRPVCDGYLFCTRDGGRIDNGYMRRIVGRQGRRAGIRHRIHTHSFRHTAACLMADNGLDIRIISQQLGHDNLSTTDAYLRHINPTRVLDAIREMDWGS